jgi:hypothetical protein
MIDHLDTLLQRLFRNAVTERRRNAPMHGSWRKVVVIGAQRAFDTVEVAS